MDSNGGVNRTLKPHEYDQLQAQAHEAGAAAEQQRQQMQQSAAVHQMYPNPDRVAEQQQPGTPQFGPTQPEPMQPGMQFPTPQISPTARSFTGGLVAGIVIGGIAMTAIRKAQVTIVPETGGND